MPSRLLLPALALAIVGVAVAWALAGLPGAPLALPAGEGDCESPSGGDAAALQEPVADGVLLRQPANAWSALGLAAAGMAVVATGRRHWTVCAAAGALVLAGVAAWWFHAGLTAWAAALDAVAVWVLLAAVAVCRWWPGPRRRGRPIAAAALPWALLAAAGLCWWLGRSGGPWCRPASLLQAHAAWHLLAAAAVGLWLLRRDAARRASPISSHPLASRREAGRQ